MLNKLQIKKLEKQQYRIVGNHSAVKVCHWTKSMIRNKGGCYKFTFYGIRSNQCMQMTTSMFCANRCIFCWRDDKAIVSKEWYGAIDKPNFIIDEAIKKHLNLLEGFGGSKKVNLNMKEVWSNVKHVALSLTGEPIVYPLINEILYEFHKRKISTFLVTNAQYPGQIDKIKYVTQLYISLDAPNKKILKEVNRPVFSDYYERLNKSLDIMAKKEFRTCIRLTIIKGKNDFDFSGYKKLIGIGNPNFVEVKGYMFLGASRIYLEKENMPTHKYIKEFSKKLVSYLPNYEIADEHKASRVVLLIKKDFKKFRFINFKKFFELINNDKIDKKEYSGNKMLPN